ncbi:hypothetical protein, partial [Serratia marcescens]|uniref:hypothetical protein n=1 Tax=Serratia marcescens TaxID=615 RepID=UPI0013DD354E
LLQSSIALAMGSGMESDLSSLVDYLTYPGVIEYISAFYLVIFLAVKSVLAFLVFVFAGVLE